MIDLKSILLQKYLQKELASFYLLKAPGTSSDKKKLLHDWIIDFLREVLKKSRTPDMASPFHHPDVLHIAAEEEKDYSLKDFQEFFTFLSYRPLELSQRFIIVEDVHHIGEQLTNKLLKPLEGPGPNVTIFFLHCTDGQLLPTLSGRAVSLKIPRAPAMAEEAGAKVARPDLAPSAMMLSWFEQHLPPSHPLRENLLSCMGPEPKTQALLAQLKVSKQLQHDLLSFLIEWERNHDSSFEHKKGMLEELQWFSLSQAYFNAPGERLSALLANLQSCRHED